MKHWVYIVLAVFVLAACSADKKATKAFRLGKYQTTIDLFKKKLATNPNDGKANYFTAESYRLSNRVKQAEPFYEKAGGRGLNPDSIKFFLAESQKANGKYDEAKKTLEELAASARDEKFKDRVEAQIAGLNYLEKLN